MGDIDDLAKYLKSIQPAVERYFKDRRYTTQSGVDFKVMWGPDKIVASKHTRTVLARFAVAVRKSSVAENSRGLNDAMAEKECMNTLRSEMRLFGIPWDKGFYQVDMRFFDEL